MASLKSAFKTYSAEELPQVNAETRRVAEEAFHAGALVVLRQVENPNKSFAAQRRRLQALATEIYEYGATMARRCTQKESTG